MSRNSSSGSGSGAAGGNGPLGNDAAILPEILPGILPAVPVGSAPVIPDKKDRRTNATTAASAAGVRALTAQALQFYFRAPAKAFFRTRVDYLAYARGPDGTVSTDGSNGKQAVHHFRRWLRGTTPGVLAVAIKRYGWSVVPDQVLPPLIANIGVAAVLYTSYLHILAEFHPESGQARRRVYPPPAPSETFTAGFLAGSLQSVVAAPLDAIQARYDHTAPPAIDANSGKPQSMWSFSYNKLREIGLRGIFAGWGLSFMKDSFGSAMFFSVFEYVKAQGYYHFVAYYYGALDDTMVLAQRQRQNALDERRERRQQWLQQLQKSIDEKKSPAHQHHHHLHHHHDGLDSFSSKPKDDNSTTLPLVIRPHYTIEPMFLLLAGISASFTQQLLLHPLNHIQVVHWDLLEDLDAVAEAEKKYAAQAAGRASVAGAGSSAAQATCSATESALAAGPGQTGSSSVPPASGAFRERSFHVFRTYYHAYQETWRRCGEQAAQEGRTRTAWLYRGFWWNAIRQVPSTSAGLIIFELVRRKYGMADEGVRISQDGYDILLE